MVKKKLKILFTASCVAMILMITPGVLVFANDIQDDSIVSEIDDSLYTDIVETTDDMSISEENESEHESNLDESTIADKDVLSDSEENSVIEELEESESITGYVEENESDSVEEVIGTGLWPVGDDVTASYNENTETLELYSDGGTLWEEWKNEIGISRDKIKSIRVVSGTVYLPENSSEMFWNLNELTSLDLTNFNTSNVKLMAGIFSGCEKLDALDFSTFDTSNVTDMCSMFFDCGNLTSLDLSAFDTSNVTNMNSMFSDCGNLTSLDLSAFDTSNVTNMDYMFYGCRELTQLDLSSFNTTKLSNANLFDYYTYLDPEEWGKLQKINTPKVNNRKIYLPKRMVDDSGKEYTMLPISSKSITLRAPKSIEKASVSGVSLSYGYSGKAYTPAVTVKLDGKLLTKDKDYSVEYKDNINPGTAQIEIVGKGLYGGTRIKTFEIVNCVSSLVSGQYYQLIPKNNSKTAVCPFSGRMVNNTKIYITDRSNSEAMWFRAIKNPDGTWKFINLKCELALAVQQNSSAVGAGLVLYDQTQKPAQNWKLVKKSDNSFAIINSVTGYSIAMSDSSAVKGTTLNMAKTASTGLQRFYIAAVAEMREGRHVIFYVRPSGGAYSNKQYAIKASANKKYALNIASSSKKDGANVNLYTYSNMNAKKFKILYSGGGYYRLVNVNSGLCLTVKGNTKADGANIIQSKWAGQSGQRWEITKCEDGTVFLTNVLGTNLHLVRNMTADGTNVVAKKGSNTKAQKWYLD